MRHLARLSSVLCAALLLVVPVALADRWDDQDGRRGDGHHHGWTKGDKGDKSDKAEDQDEPAEDGERSGRGKDRADKGTEADVPPAPMLQKPGAPEHPELTELGKTVGAAPKSGAVTVKRPGEESFAPLEADAPLPVGSVVDATDGLVEIGSEAAGGVEQNAVVTGSVFQIDQPADGDGTTDLVLQGGDFSDCHHMGRSRARSAGKPRAHAARRRRHRHRYRTRGRVSRGIWAAGTGKFRTRGRYGAATVRGTRWAVVDRCHSTTIKVFEGVVDVEDFATGRTVAVRAGERRVVREPRG